MKNNIFFLLILFFQIGFSQIFNADSLKQVIKTTKSFEEKAECYGALSWGLIDTNLKEAIIYNDSSFAISKKNNYNNGIEKAYYKYSVLNRALGNYDKALMYLNKFEKYVKEDTLRLANAAFQKGVLNSIKGDFDEGLKFYQIAIKKYQILNKKNGVGMTYNTIGITFSNMKRYDEAIKNFKKSIEILDEINDINGIASTYTNIGNAYDNKGENEEALKYFYKSIDLSTKTSNIRRIAENKQNIAAVYKQQKNYTKALKLAKEAYKILKENNYHGELTGATANLAEIYTLLGKYKESELILKQSLKSLKGSAKDKASLQNSLYKLYEKTKQYKKAFLHLKAYKTLTDSIVNEKSLKNLDNLQIKFDTEKKDKEIVQQQLQIKSTASKLQKKKTQNNYMIGIALFLLLASILTLLIFKQRQKRKNQEIVSLKREYQVKSLESLIQGEEKERLRIAKELHDGVNGDLSAIKHKLNTLLQLNNKTIEEAVTMIDKSCEQVRAISHNLVPPALENFDLKTAIADFCTNKNNLHKPKIKFNYLGDDIKLSKIVEINIFRIVQELVNNSIKHANATKINVQFSVRNNDIQLAVEDNGKGFNAYDVKSDGIGIANVKSRVSFLNGEIDFSSNKEGTSVNIFMDKTRFNDD